MAGQGNRVVEPDYTSLGFPSTEYIVYNLQAVTNHTQLNGGKLRFPIKNKIKQLPLASLVFHVYKDYIEARIIPEEEFMMEKSLEKGLVAESPGEKKKDE